MQYFVAWIDYSLTIDIGRWGFTVGPFFLAINRDGDIHRMWCLRDMHWQSQRNFEWTNVPAYRGE